MAKERKKVVRKPLPTVAPKQRVLPKSKKSSTKPAPKAEPKPVEYEGPKHNLKFVKICEGSKIEEFRGAGERVMRGELKWHHYAVDGNKGCHYYLIIKKD
jgi:hypothetical protein